MTLMTEKDTAVRKIQNSAEALNSDMQNAANQVGQKVRGLINSANDEIQEMSGKVTSQIRTNPVQSTVIALVLGVLLGVLLRR